MATILGESALSDTDKAYLEFTDLFEEKFLSQAEDENREIEDTLDIGWEVLRVLPREELKRIKDDKIEKYLDEKEN